MITDTLHQAIEKVSQKLGLPELNFVLEHPNDELHGDYAANIAMLAAKELKSNPRQLAEQIKQTLESERLLVGLVDKIEVAGPGFINFYLSPDWFVAEIASILEEGDKYGSKPQSGKRILVDYSAPNIAKRFSVGHLRSTIIGQAVINLYGFLGWDTVGDNHLGDWGTQFGIIIAAIEEKGIDASTLSVEDLEKLYVDFNARIKEDPSLKDLGREAFARLEQGEAGARQIWQQAIQTSLKEFDRIYDILGVKIDNAYGESAYEELMKEVISEAKDKGVTCESQGAWIVELDNLPPAMLIKSNGTTTYFTRDLATIKFRQNNPALKSDLYVYEVGAEQTLHFQQVFAAAKKLGWLKDGQMVHIAHGLVLGPDGKKLSTRKGTAAKLEDLLNSMIDEAAKFNPASSKSVGIGAVKFADLKHRPQSNYVFDAVQALKLEGDTGPYLQYAYARAKSVLTKSASSPKIVQKDFNEDEKSLMRMVVRFPQIVEASASGFVPNLLVDYLLELAARFSRFYNQNRIIGDQNEECRLALTAATAQVIKNGLLLLGIEPIESM